MRNQKYTYRADESRWISLAANTKFKLGDIVFDCFGTESRVINVRNCYGPLELLIENPNWERRWVEAKYLKIEEGK